MLDRTHQKLPRMRGKNGSVGTNTQASNSSASEYTGVSHTEVQAESEDEPLPKVSRERGNGKHPG
jgi:hypothetical protein